MVPEAESDFLALEAKQRAEGYSKILIFFFFLLWSYSFSPDVIHSGWLGSKHPTN